MPTINDVKQQSEASTPLLFFQCVLPSGTTEYWCTHAVSVEGVAYSARVLKHNVFELQVAADDAMDGVSQLSITLANADSYLSEISRESGFKGAQLTVSLAFADLPSAAAATESITLFRGVAGDPDEITEEWLQLTFTNKLSLQRIPVPEVRIQRSCPWTFPVNLDQRSEAVNGGEAAQFSRFYRCGYSADVPGGVGNLNNGVAFSTCDFSRVQCQQRGMFGKDRRGNITQRFGGVEFVPSAIQVRTAGNKTSHLSALLQNSAKYNDPVPLIYGTGWLKAPISFSRNDGNLTHMEVILGMGVLTGILKVVVNDVEIPLGVAGVSVGTTGWYGIVTSGGRTGNFNYDFTDSSGAPLGDPYGSIAVLSVVVPNRICLGSALPNVEVLLQGMQLDTYDLQGNRQPPTFTSNPSWAILDILRRCGWSESEVDLSSFALSAAHCDALINTTDLNGNPLSIPRYQTSLILTKRQSAASVVRGIRVAASLMLRYGSTGLLELAPESTIADQQPQLPDGSNSVELLNGGWPAYEFSDASAAYSGIVRLPNGSSSVRLTSRSVAETPNRLSVEFQDSFNEYQQDSLSVVDSDDSGLIGYEISSQSTALGIANMSQATRVLLRQLDKSTAGNLYVQFQTSFRAVKVNVGDIITLTYAKEGLIRIPFRVTKLVPSLNYELVTILAQVHDDNWYSDDPIVLAGAGRQPLSQVQTPRPLVGVLLHSDPNGGFEFFDLGIQEQLWAQSDGSATDTLTVAFSQPTMPSPASPGVPLLSLSPQYASVGGSLNGGTSLYYAVSAVDVSGREGPLSFTVASVIPVGTNSNTVTVTGLSFASDTASFHVYRGLSPQVLYRIASNVSIGNAFTDTGLPALPIGPPDPSFDHANCYYRYEYAGPFAATTTGSNMIASADMGAVPLAYVGRTVRIIEGTGRGQERPISANDATSITLSSSWSVMPDTTSEFVIVESAWRFAAVSTTTPIRFEIAYEPGMVIEITARSTNVSNIEAVPELCPITRWALGGGKADSGTASTPAYTLAAPGAGLVTISQVGFDDLTNISSVGSGTLQLYSWNELNIQGQTKLASALDNQTAIIPVVPAATAYVGQILALDTELLTVLSVNTATSAYTVARGSFGSQAASHAANANVLHLMPTTIVVPFTLNFFENRAALNFIHTFTMPDARICAASFFVTNAFGDSQATQQFYTMLPDGGLRTLSGGQVAMQVSGTLATQQDAAPALVVEASHAVRDMRASVNQAPSGYTIHVDLLQAGVIYASMEIASGSTVSAVVDGSTLPPLTEGSTLTVNVTLDVPQTFLASMSPGRDLTVTVRL